MYVSGTPSPHTKRPSPFRRLHTDSRLCRSSPHPAPSRDHHPPLDDIHLELWCPQSTVDSFQDRIRDGPLRGFCPDTLTYYSDYETVVPRRCPRSVTLVSPPVGSYGWDTQEVVSLFSSGRRVGSLPSLRPDSEGITGRTTRMRVVSGRFV